jgi:putative transposase
MAALLATETLEPAKMTRSARGTVEEPGTQVRQKAGLNRSILDGAPAAFLAMLRYKAEEAGSAFVEVPARKVKPSQTCAGCGRVEKKALSQRMHECACGVVLARDHAAALVCLNYALYGVGNRPGVDAGATGPPPPHETPPVAAPAVQGA